MKRYLLMALLTTCIGLSTSAEVVIRKYYGSKARNSNVNPCKGALVDVCAEITTQIWLDKSNILSSQTMVRNTTLDSENKIIRTEEHATDLTPTVVLDNIIKTLPENAVIISIDYNEKGTGN